MKMKFSFVALVLALLIGRDALALGAVSRACQFSTLPTGTKGIAVQFFEAIGADAWTLSLPDESSWIQSKWWINEALTTDYIRQRYYLYAIAEVYGQVVEPESTFYGQWKYYKSYRSPKWTSETVSEQMKRDPTFSPYYANRGDLYSARAGELYIFEQPSSHFGKFIVLGAHFYFDPVSKITARLPDTRARDCNLGNWGFGLFDR